MSDANIYPFPRPGAPGDPDRYGERDGAGEAPGGLERWPLEDDIDVPSTALFAGDTGTLTELERRALVMLLKRPFISARTHEKEWRAVSENPAVFRSRLNDLFLELALDTDREVAFKRQVLTETGDRFPTLLHDTGWTREETLLLVLARSRYRAERLGGAERVFLDRDDMIEHVLAYQSANATDRSGNRRRAERGIETLNRAKLLIGHSRVDRFEISAAIESLMPLEKLRELCTWLHREATGTDTGDGDEPAEDAGDGQGETRSQDNEDAGENA